MLNSSVKTGACEGPRRRGSSEFHCKVYSFEVVSPVQWFSNQGWFVCGRLVTRGGHREKRLTEGMGARDSYANERSSSLLQAKCPPGSEWSQLIVKYLGIWYNCE